MRITNQENRNFAIEYLDKRLTERYARRLTIYYIINDMELKTAVFSEKI